MAIDFEIPEDAKAVRARVREWVEQECIPAEARLKDKESFQAVLAELRTKARAQGLWLPFIPKEYGGRRDLPYDTTSADAAERKDKTGR